MFSSNQSSSSVLPAYLSSTTMSPLLYTLLFSSNQSSSSVLPAYLAYTSLAFCSLVLAVGVLGNLLVLLVIITSKSMRYDNSSLITNLAKCSGAKPHMRKDTGGWEK